MDEPNARPGLVLVCSPGSEEALAILVAQRLRTYSQIILWPVEYAVSVEQARANALRVCCLAGASAPIPRVETPPNLQHAVVEKLEPVSGFDGRDGLGAVPERLFPQGAEVEEPGAADGLRGETSSHRDKAVESWDFVCTVPPIAKVIFKDKEKAGGPPSAQWRKMVFVLDNPTECATGAVQPCVGFSTGGTSEAGVQAVGLGAADLSWPILRWGPPKARGESTGEEDDGRLALVLRYMLRERFLHHALRCDPPFGEDGTRLEGEAAKARGKELRNRVMQDRIAGGGGLKRLPLWCYMPSTLAVWEAAKDVSVAGAAATKPDPEGTKPQPASASRDKGGDGAQAILGQLLASVSARGAII